MIEKYKKVNMTNYVVFVKTCYLTRIFLITQNYKIKLINIFYTCRKKYKYIKFINFPLSINCYIILLLFFIFYMKCITYPPQ